MSSNSGFSKSLYEMVEGVKDEDIQMYLSKTSQIVGAINNFWMAYNDKVNQGFVGTLDGVVHQELTNAKMMHKAWSTLRIELDVVQGRYDSLLKGSWDGVKMFVQQCQLASAIDSEKAAWDEACNTIGDALWNRDIVMLRACISLIRNLQDHNLQTYTEFVDADSVMRELDERLEKAQKDLDDIRQKRDDDKMQRTKEEFDARYHPLVDLLSSEDLALVNAVAVTSGSEQEEILRTVIYILVAHQKAMPIIFLTISKEVEETTDASTLFRGNTCATKLMSQFTRMTGRSYLEDTILDVINEICNDPYGYEVDPQKIREGTVEENMEKLVSTTQKMLDSILENKHLCPPAFKLIASHLVSEIIAKFPDAKNTAVGGFIFLRFFCPAIMSPDSQNLVEGVIDGNARRPLILISKSIQNLSNGIEFGTKESYMEPMNEFIQRNSQRVEDFFDFLAEPSDEQDLDPLASMDEVMSFHIPSLHLKIVQNLEKIAKNLMLYKQDLILPELCSILGSLGSVDVEIIEEPSLKKMKKKK